MKRPPRLATAAGALEARFIAALVRASTCATHSQLLSSFYTRSNSTRSAHNRHAASRSVRIGVRGHASAAYLADALHDSSETSVSMHDVGEIKPRTRIRKGLPRRSALDCDLEFFEPNESDLSAAVSAVEAPSAAKRNVLQDFLATLPLRNFANDFAFWDMSPAEVWSRYQLLPEPRCKSISRVALRLVLAALNNRDAGPVTKTTSQRYLEIFEQMRAHGVEPTVDEWTTATYMRTRSTITPTSETLRTARSLFDDMESAGFEPKTTTLNVLLDAAVRAGDKHEVKWLLDEYLQRKLNFDAFTHTMLMRWAAQEGKPDAVVSLYTSMCSRRDPIDMVVVNCLVDSLARAGRPDKAWHLYLAVRNGALAVQGAIKLDAWSLVPHLEGRRTHRPTTQQSHRTRPLRPDNATINSLLVKPCMVGNLEQVRVLLDDMRLFDLVENEATYIYLFQGFVRHGMSERTLQQHAALDVSPEKDRTAQTIRDRHRQPGWTLQRLEKIFSNLLSPQGVAVLPLNRGRGPQTPSSQEYEDATVAASAQTTRTGNTKLTRRLMITVLEAFAECTDDLARIQEVYDQLDEVWRVRQGGHPDRRSKTVCDMVDACKVIVRERNRSLGYEETT